MKVFHSSSLQRNLSSFLLLRTCIIEGIIFSLHKYRSGILNCRQRTLIEKHGFLPGTHCSNLANILCLTYWPKYIPSTCIILSRFINTQGYGSLIGVLCLLDILSDWQESAGIGWCIFQGITAVAIIVIGYCLYHYCNIQELLQFTNTVYICFFVTDMQWTMVCSLCLCVFVCIHAWD